MNLAQLRAEGIMIDELLKHYALCCEYMWTKIDDSEEGNSIYVIDLWRELDFVILQVKLSILSKK